MADNSETTLNELTRSLQAALGDNLVALMLYGSGARGGHVPGRSDLNVLLVVRDASAAALARTTPALRAWAKQGQPAPLIQTEADWAAAADVFPIELEDIREAHRVLAGRDVLSAITTTRDDQRRELEREARGKLIQLRADYAVSADDGRALAELLVRATSTFQVLMRAALRLTDATLPADRDTLLRAAGAAGFDPEPFAWALAARRAGARPSLTPRDPLAAAYLAAVEQFVAYVDSL